MNPNGFTLEALENPMSSTSEAFRLLGVNVNFADLDKGLKTIVITSPLPGDGKTTMACNLSIAMAQAGQRVLLIDGDFRKPRVHKVFEMDGEVGLSNVLAGRTEVYDAIQTNGMVGLSILPCGPTPPTRR